MVPTKIGLVPTKIGLVPTKKRFYIDANVSPMNILNHLYYLQNMF